MRLFRFGHLMEAVEALALLEDLTYDQLFRMSDPKRFDRSLTVKMPPMEIEQFQSAGAYVFRYYFNAKGNPSTTGLRHRGYVQFKKPKKKGGRNIPLSQLPVEVDCMCPDYRYRWAWANKQKRAGKIGPNSLNQCINKAPRKTNPHGKPGLCKHILATRDYIYGLLSGLPDTMGPTDKLDKLTQRATKRWLNFDADMQAARERDAKIAAAKARRNVGVPPYEQNKLVNKLQTQEPPEVPLEAPPLAVPPGQRGRGFPPAPPKPPSPPKAPKPPQPPKPGKAGQTAAKPGAKPASKTGKPNPKQGVKPRPKPGRGSRKVESVDMMTMKTLTLQEAQVVGKARKLVEEMAEEFGGIDDMGGGGGDEGMPPGSGADMPMEPPVSDSAVGASTEDNVALGLLREIRDLLGQMAADTTMEEGGEAPELPEEEGAEEGEEGASDEEDFKPGKRPMPVPSGAGD